jgi:DNA-binding GntR family transcriptional regulator
MQQAYLEIKDRIVTLELQPGQRLDDIDLGLQLGLSRTPVREALHRLMSEGLVTISPGDGMAVRALNLLDVGQLFEAHIVVARAVARLCAVRANKEDIVCLRTAARDVELAISQRSAKEIASTNATFHRLEAAHARNDHLKALAWAVHDQGQRLAYLCFGGRDAWTDGLTDHFSRVTADHENFLTAVEDHDADTAEMVAARHVHLFRDRVQTLMISDEVDGIHLQAELPAWQMP